MLQQANVCTIPHHSLPSPKIKVPSHEYVTAVEESRRLSLHEYEGKRLIFHYFCKYIISIEKYKRITVNEIKNHNNTKTNFFKLQNLFWEISHLSLVFEDEIRKIFCVGI